MACSPCGATSSISSIFSAPRGAHLALAPFQRPMLSETSAPNINRLLGTLPEADLQRLMPELKLVTLHQGDILHEPGATQHHVIFPISGIVMLLNLMEDGSSAETAMIGNEGLIGVPVFLGVTSATSQAVVQSEGLGYRIKAETVRKESRLGGALQQWALRFTQALITQMAQTAVCNRHHTVDQRMCRWLLLSQDRLLTDELRITQESIASMLGVRREAVTEAARKLQDAELISYSRGRINILDRTKLEERVCECYAVVKREYGRLLPHAINNLYERH